jgi:hypothetical protein
MKICAVIGCLLLVTVAVSAGEKPSSARQLKTGSILTVKTRREMPVSRILEYIEAKSGNRVDIVDEFGRPVESILSQPITLSMSKKPFWEVVQALMEATSTRFCRIKDNTLQLSPRSRELPDFHNLRVAGPPVVDGPFLVQPLYHTFFDEVVICLRPEPSLTAPRLVEGRAILTSGGGKKTVSNLLVVSDSFAKNTGELRMDLDRAEGADSLRLEADIAVPVNRELMKLPSVGVLLEKTKKVPLEVGKLKIKVTGAKKEKDLLNSLNVSLEIAGGRLRPEDVCLLDGEGNSVDTIGHLNAGGGDTQELSQFFSLETIKGNPLRCRLAVRTSARFLSRKIKTTLKDLHFDKKD